MNQSKRNVPKSTQPFEGKGRHYHYRTSGDEVTWDDWIGVKTKGPVRRRLEKFFLNAGTMVVGMGITLVLIGGCYVVMKKVLPMISK